jgi:hypothetical protein
MRGLDAAARAALENVVSRDVDAVRAISPPSPPPSRLRAAAPPAVAARLRERGLLPDTLDELTEFAR